jgi:hypothetical protein
LRGIQPLFAKSREKPWKKAGGLPLWKNASNHRMLFFIAEISGYQAKNSDLIAQSSQIKDNMR